MMINFIFLLAGVAIGIVLIYLIRGKTYFKDKGKSEIVLEVKIDEEAYNTTLEKIRHLQYQCSRIQVSGDIAIKGNDLTTKDSAE